MSARTETAPASTLDSLLCELEELVTEADRKAANNMRNSRYEERGKGQLDVALDLQRIIARYKEKV